ncbi:MAG: DUF7220 family protein [Candidatus Binatus sp.]
MLVGFGVAVATQVAIFPLFGLRTTLAENLAITPSSKLCRSPGRTACEGCSSGFGSVWKQQRRRTSTCRRRLDGLFKRSGRPDRASRSSLRSRPGRVSS